MPYAARSSHSDTPYTSSLWGSLSSSAFHGCTGYTYPCTQNSNSNTPGNASPRPACHEASESGAVFYYCRWTNGGEDFTDVTTDDDRDDGAHDARGCGIDWGMPGRADSDWCSSYVEKKYSDLRLIVLVINHFIK